VKRRALDGIDERPPGAEGTTVRKRHQLTLKHRESMSVEGVINVESFDNQQVLLETDQGMMIVRGDGLHIKELNLEGGSLLVDGFVQSIEYIGDGPRPKGRGKGLLGKIFR
jgi:sporulation protein YabP